RSIHARNRCRLRTVSYFERSNFCRWPASSRAAASVCGVGAPFALLCTSPPPLRGRAREGGIFWATGVRSPPSRPASPVGLPLKGGGEDSSVGAAIPL